MGYNIRLETKMSKYSISLNSPYYISTAASAMYECALRVGSESDGEESLKLQLKCYLACINCLKLLPSHTAWILKPNPSPSSEDCKTRKTSGRVISSMSGRKRKSCSAAVEVLELPQIDNEYELVHARLTLATLSTSPTNVGQ